jgi:hypothetical protein
MLIALALAVGMGLGEGGHPLSLSRLSLDLKEDALHLEWTVQALTIIEIPGETIDTNHDESLSRQEILAHWPRLREYLESGFALRVDDLEWAPQFEVFELSPNGQNLIVRATLALLQTPATGTAPPEPVTTIAITTHHFFADGNPDHRMHIRLTGLTAEPQFYLLSERLRSVIFPVPTSDSGAQPHQIFPTYFKLGWQHVLAGWDHLAFLLALLFGIGGIRALVWAVTAFTLAHSITLSLAALDVFRLPASLVEPTIAASIAIVLWWHLHRGKDLAKAWKPAFLFGLIHGFGFAGALQGIGIPPDARFSSLFGFNLGVEAGQLCFVLPAFAVGFIASPRLLPTRWQAEARRTVVLLLTAVAFHYMVQAAGWWFAAIVSLAGLAFFRRPLNRTDHPMAGAVEGWLILGCYWLGTQL